MAASLPEDEGLQQMMKELSLPNDSKPIKYLAEMNKRAEIFVKEEFEKQMFDFTVNKKKAPIRYEDPVPSLSKDDTWGWMILFERVVTRMDYLPNNVPLLRVKHFSNWMLNIYLGNHSEFDKQIKKMSKAELERHLKMRETLLQVGAIYHVIEGAATLFSGSPILDDARAVHGQVELEHMKILQKLILLGAEVEARDIRGNTPLQHCVTGIPSELTLKMAEILLTNGADPNGADFEGMTPLHICILLKGRENFAKLLIKHGADPYLKTNQGTSPMDLTVYDISPMVKMTLEVNKKEISKQKTRAMEKEDYKMCGVCKEVSSKKCAGRQLEWYCSIECQRKDWETHKVTCAKRREEYLPIKLLSRVPTDGESKPRQSEFIVTVHIHAFEFPGDDMPMKVYSKDGSVQGQISTASPEGMLLLETIKQKGFQGMKGHFNAKMEDGQLYIHPKILPPQIW